MNKKRDYKYIYFKYRDKWSHGPGHWRLKELEVRNLKNKAYDVTDSIQDYLDEISSNINSEHFRGYDYKILNYIPTEFIENRITDYVDNIKYYKKEINRLSRLKTKKIKNSCNNCCNGPRKDCHPVHKDKCKKCSEWSSM